MPDLYSRPGFPNNAGYSIYPRYEIMRVHGEESARSFKMAPNSECFLADLTDPHRMWLAQTDGTGFMTLTQLDVNIHQDIPQPTLEERIKHLEDAYEQLLNSGFNKQPKKRNTTTTTNESTNATN